MVRWEIDIQLPMQKHPLAVENYLAVGVQSGAIVAHNTDYASTYTIRDAHFSKLLLQSKVSSFTPGQPKHCL